MICKKKLNVSINNEYKIQILIIIVCKCLEHNQLQFQNQKCLFSCQVNKVSLLALTRKKNLRRNGIKSGSPLVRPVYKSLVVCQNLSKSIDPRYFISLQNSIYEMFSTFFFFFFITANGVNIYCRLLVFSFRFSFFFFLLQPFSLRLRLGTAIVFHVITPTPRRKITIQNSP